MKQTLHDYDIYPKVFPVGRAVDITVRGLGVHTAFSGDYTVVVQRLDGGSLRFPFSAGNHTDLPVTAADGCLRFTYTADKEGELAVRIYRAPENTQRIVQMNLYALDEDLACRIPLRGDLHMHTCRSDGRGDPAVVCADYREGGYDFIVITDHYRYYPSLEAMRAYKDVDLALNILPGEEVHLPQTDVHIVNAGGLYSVNGLFADLPNARDTGASVDGRRLDETVTPPDMIAPEDYNAALDAIEASLDDCPADVDRRWYAVCVWAFDRIREAGGLAIFAHPYWIADMWHVPEALTMYLMEKHPFDAFEVLGGENYYEQNGFQSSLYYEEYKAGRVHPIVGSTDSHNSTENNRNARICSTIVFAHENDRADIIASIKERYSVAVDTISAEYRLVGEFRLQKYACFLMEEFYPLHDRIAHTDGEMMRRYYYGEIDGALLSAAADASKAMFDKYFLR